MATTLPADVHASLIAAGGGVTIAVLRGWGLSDGQVARLVRDGELIRSSRGSYVLPPSETNDYWAGRRSEHLKTLAARLPADGVAGFRSAALLLGLPVAEIPGEPEVIRPPRAHRSAGVRTTCSPLRTDEVTRVNGIPTTNVSRTCVDVALRCPLPLALVTLDAALRRGGDRHLMVQLLQERPRASGSRRALTALQWADPGAETPLESLGRGEMLIRRVPPPTCNPTFRFQGEEFRPDAYWPEFGLVGEADGAGKYDLGATSRGLWREKLRQHWFETALGLRVFRWVFAEVRHDPEGMVERWWQMAQAPASKLWMPPEGLEVICRPPRLILPIPLMESGVVGTRVERANRG